MCKDISFKVNCQCHGEYINYLKMLVRINLLFLHFSIGNN